MGGKSNEWGETVQYRKVKQGADVLAGLADFAVAVRDGADFQASSAKSGDAGPGVRVQMGADCFALS